MGCCPGHPDCPGWYQLGRGGQMYGRCPPPEGAETGAETGVGESTGAGRAAGTGAAIGGVTGAGAGTAGVEDGQQV